MPSLGGRGLRSAGIIFAVDTSARSSTGARSPVTSAASFRVSYLTVAALVVLAVLAASIVVADSRAPWSLASVVTLAVLARAADVDRRELRLPDSMVGLAALPMLVVLAAGPLFGRAEIATGVLAGAVLAVLPVAALHLSSPSAMGFGDVKAAAVLGAAIGVVEWRLAMVALCLAAGTAVVSCAIRRRRSIAFGPFLVGGAVATLVIARLAPPEVFPWP